jgi:hypothetical protein
MLIAFMQHERILCSLQAICKEKQVVWYEQQNKSLSYLCSAEVQFLKDTSQVHKQPPSSSAKLL